MKCILLAAGCGTRLYPLTRDKPKCMVDIAETPIIEIQVKNLKNAGVEEICVVGGYHANKISKVYDSLIINNSYETTNMVYSLFCAEKYFSGEDDIIVCYGDIVCETKVISKIIHSSSEISIAIDKNWQRYWEIRMSDPLQDAETLRVNFANEIEEIGKKPQSYEDIQGQYMGIFKIRADYAPIVKKIYYEMDAEKLYDGKNFNNMFMTSFLQYLINKKIRLTAVPVENGWLELDTVNDYEIYNKMAKNNTLAKFFSLSD